MCVLICMHKQNTDQLILNKKIKTKLLHRLVKVKNLQNTFDWDDMNMCTKFDGSLYSTVEVMLKTINNNIVVVIDGKSGASVGFIICQH